MRSFIIDPDGDGLVLIASGDSQYIVGNIEGLDMPDDRLSSYDNPGEDGATVSAHLYSSRLVTVTGKVKGDTPTLFDQACNDLAYACRIRRNNRGYPIATRFSFITLDGKQFFFDGHVNRAKLPSKLYPNHGRLLIPIMVTSPMLFGDAILSGRISPPLAAGVSFPWIFDPTIEFGTTSGGSVSISNNGNADTWPIIYLRGILSNPTIYSVVRGISMKLNYVTANASDETIIDMKNHTIILNGIASLLGEKDNDADWFSLAPGSNPILFSTASASDSGTMEVSANNAFLGV